MLHVSLATSRHGERGSVESEKPRDARGKLRRHLKEGGSALNVDQTRGLDTPRFTKETAQVNRGGNHNAQATRFRILRDLCRCWLGGFVGRRSRSATAL